MDDPIIGPSDSLRLQRTCEGNRLEKQFLTAAYERLVAIVEGRKSPIPVSSITVTGLGAQEVLS